MTDTWIIVGALILTGTAFTAAGAVTFYLGVRFGAGLWYRAGNNMAPSEPRDVDVEPETAA